MKSKTPELCVIGGGAAGLAAAVEAARAFRQAGIPVTFGNLAGKHGSDAPVGIGDGIIQRYFLLELDGSFSMKNDIRILHVLYLMHLVCRMMDRCISRLLREV